jgi:glycosyltransferase involved in cell wall biosynthesis
MYALADVMAFPSRYEGFGIPVLEAMAAGCPVIASTSTALPEAVGDAGLLVDPDDIDGWTNALRRVLTDRGLSDDLRQRGYRRAAEFTVARSAASLRQAYTLAHQGHLR